MPLHPLLVHFAVVFVILAALGQLGAALIPRVRRWLGWVQPAFSVVTSITVLLTAGAGNQLLIEHSGHSDHSHEAAFTHATWGGALATWVWVFLLTVVAFWLVATVSAKPGSVLAKVQHPVAKWVIGGLSVVLSGVMLFLVFMTGDTGAASVWGS